MTTMSYRSRTALLRAASALVLLSAGQAMAQTAPASNEEPSQVDEVIVTGFRASLANALNLKKNSNLIIESVTAEDMGKFPDQNIAESLQRMPGVQIDRENGRVALVLHPTLARDQLFAGMLGVTCILLGLLAELVTRTWFESQGRSTYLIRSKRNVD